MVTTIPSGASQGTQYPIRLGDNATAGAGSYEIYLNALKSDEKWSFPPIAGTEVHLETDQNIAAQLGAVTGDFTLQNCHLANDQTTIDNLKKALVYWASIGAPITYSEKKNGSTEMMRWPAYGTLTMTQIKVRVMGLAITDKSSDVYIFNLMLRRFNTA